MLSIIKTGAFLPVSVPTRRSHLFPNFYSNDSHEKYLKNLSVKPKDWIYRTKSIKYTVNQSDYRCPEWSDIDWASSIIMFGCSIVFGLGVDDSETIPYYLSKMLNIPVINMGVVGSSMGYSHHNALQYLYAGHPMPKAVINMWTVANRLCEFRSNDIVSHGHWNSGPDSLFDRHNQYRENSQVLAIGYERAARIFWKDIVYLSASSCYPTMQLLDLENIWELCKCESNARDDRHMGPDSNYRVAEYLAGKLTSLM